MTNMQNYLDILESRLADTVVYALESCILGAVSIILVVFSGYFMFRKRPKVKTTKSRKIYKNEPTAGDKVLRKAGMFFFGAAILCTCLQALSSWYYIDLYYDTRYDIENKSFCKVTGTYDEDDRNRRWVSTTVTDGEGNKIHLTNGYRNTFTIDKDPPVTFVFGERSKILVEWYKSSE